MEIMEKARAKAVMTGTELEKLKEIFLGELQEHKASFGIASDIVDMIMESGSIIGALEDYVNDPMNSDSSVSSSAALPAVNTYPFGFPTDKIFPEFLGICVGNCRIDDVFRAARDHLVNFNADDQGHVKQSVTIITDKWSKKMFSRFEPVFLTFALNDDVTFNFYLATDYGIIPIPFINEEMKDIMKNIGDIDLFDLQNEFEKTRKAANVRDMTYTVRQHDSFLPSYECKNFTYTLDLETLRYSYRDDHDNIGYGTVKKEYAQKFLNAALAIDRAGGLSKGDIPTNFIENKVTMGNISFSWFNTDISGMSCDARKMVIALNTLISMVTLKKETL
ncbi:MAG: hypothetical protein ACI4XF_08770 [Oscillospiraceae bacterium]